MHIPTARTLGRNEKVYLLWYRRRKLFSRRLALVGRKTEQKPQRIVNVREKTGRDYFKGKAEQLGSDWDTGKEVVGKKK